MSNQYYQPQPHNDIPMWAWILIFVLVLSVGVITLNAVMSNWVDREIEEQYQATPTPTIPGNSV